MTARCIGGLVKRPSVRSAEVRTSNDPLMMSDRAHVDLENGFVHVDDEILPIVCMIDEDNQETKDVAKAALVVAGSDSKGFVVVAN